MFNEKCRFAEFADAKLDNLAKDLGLEGAYDGSKGQDKSAADAIDAALDTLMSLQDAELVRLTAVMVELRKVPPSVE